MIDSMEETYEIEKKFVTKPLLRDTRCSGIELGVPLARDKQAPY